MSEHTGSAFLRGGLFAFLFAAALLAAPGALQAQLYSPPGYGSGSSVSGFGAGMEVGYETVDDDQYLILKPLLEIPFFFDIRVGLQIPLEVLIKDNEPLQNAKTPSIRTGTYDDVYDYLRLIKYAKRGKHLYYKPGDDYNWSFYYGEMTDGYIGHKTLVYRYYSNYDPTVWKPGLMAEINNDWGGIEAFASDVFRKEAVAGRGYVRPVGIVTSVHDVLFTYGGTFSPTMVAMSMRENRDPRLNGGIFYQEIKDKEEEKHKMIDAGKSGRLQQHLYPTMQESIPPDTDTNKPVRFERMVDPVTGQEQVRAMPENQPASQQPEQLPQQPESKASKWSPSFWNRWAVGYTIAKDKDAPLTLETDGSGNLVIDPTQKRPRAGTVDEFTAVGMDTEFRLSPFQWLELTPYVDLNKFKDVDNAKGLHAGIDTEIKLGDSLRLVLRPEYREMSSNYIPAYFDSYYSIERTAIQPRGVSDFSGISSAAGMTKLTYLKSLPDDGPKVKGYFAQAMLDFSNTFVIESTFEDYNGPNNSKIFVGFYIPNAFGIFADGYYTKKGFNSIKESFEYDDRCLAAAELGYGFPLGIYAKVTFQRTWVFNNTNSTYQANDQITYSAGFSSTF